MSDYREEGTVEAVLVRRQNADLVDTTTPEGRVYRRLLHVQIDLQVEGDEKGETFLIDLLDTWWLDKISHAER